MGERIIFYHIPKTAGQAVNEVLRGGFKKRLFFPGGMDHHLALFASEDLKKYGVFVGHMSIGPLECLSPSYSFSILRNPIDRILSAYRYQREKGSKLSLADRALPENRAAQAAAAMGLDEFLAPSDNDLRMSVHNSLDNFYTYFFGTRHFNGRITLGVVSEDVKETVMQNALQNITGSVNIFFVDQLDRLVRALAQQHDFEERPIRHVNVSGEALTEQTRNNFIETHSKNTKAAYQLLDEFTSHDRKLYATLRDRTNA